MARYILLFLLFYSSNIIGQSNEDIIAHNNAVKAFKAQDFASGIYFLKNVVEENPEFLSAQRLIAECYKEVKNEEKAQKHYQKVLQIEGNQPQVWYSLSLSYIRSNKFDEAKYTLNKVLELDPNHAKAQRRLECLDVRKKNALKNDILTSKGESTLKVATPQKNISSNNDLVSKSSPNHNTAIKYVNKGVRFYNEKQFSDAKIHFEKAIELSPKADFYLFSGRSKLHLNELDEAVEDLKKAVALNSDNGEYHYYLSKAYELKGIENLTQKHAEMASNRGFEGTNEVFNSVATKHYNQGIELHQNKKYPEAVKEFLRAIEKDHNNPKYYSNLASTYIEMKRYKEAKKVLEQGIDVDPSFANFYRLLGSIYYQEEYFRKAGAYYQEAINLGNTSFQDYLNVGYCYDNLGNFKEALSYFKEAEKLNPTHFEIMFTVGLTYFKANNNDKAIEYFKKLHGLKPEHTATLYNLSAIYLRTGQFKEALDYALKIVELKPGEGRAYHQVGMIYGHMEDFDNKDKYMRKAKSLGFNKDPMHY